MCIIARQCRAEMHFENILIISMTWKFLESNIQWELYATIAGQEIVGASRHDFLPAIVAYNSTILSITEF